METSARPQSKKITHILFDFYGTLVEYNASRIEQGYERAHQVLLSAGASLTYQDFLRRFSALWEEFECKAEISHDEYSTDVVVNAFLKDLIARPNPKLVETFRDTYLTEWRKGVRYIDGVPAMLRSLAQRYTLALVTNTHTAGPIRGHLREMNIEGCFSGVVTSVEHGKRKPAASIFEFALTATGGGKSTALYVGDSFKADYVGATRAGLRCLLIDPNRKADIPDEHRIDHILALRDIARSASE